MKIQFTKQDIDDVAAQVATSAKAILANRLAQLDEQELIRELNATIRDEKTKVLQYLRRTQIGVSSSDEDTEMVAVESGYLRERLRIAPLRMKAIRDDLETAGTIDVIRQSHQPITIRHRRGQQQGNS